MEKIIRIFNDFSDFFNFQLVTYGDSRTEALDTMTTALDSYVIKG
jgi:acetyl/propionyl-CoA carboxylase alpha subunit